MLSICCTHTASFFSSQHRARPLAGASCLGKPHLGKLLCYVARPTASVAEDAVDAGQSKGRGQPLSSRDGHEEEEEHEHESNQVRFAHVAHVAM